MADELVVEDMRPCSSCGVLFVPANPVDMICNACSAGNRQSDMIDENQQPTEAWAVRHIEHLSVQLQKSLEFYLTTFHSDLFDSPEIQQGYVDGLLAGITALLPMEEEADDHSS